jgi:hypothetical protein
MVSTCSSVKGTASESATLGVAIGRAGLVLIQLKSSANLKNVFIRSMCFDAVLGDIFQVFRNSRQYRRRRWSLIPELITPRSEFRRNFPSHRLPIRCAVESICRTHREWHDHTDSRTLLSYTARYRCVGSIGRRTEEGNSLVQPSIERSNQTRRLPLG